jgi:sulfur carrier protein ThiS
MESQSNRRACHRSTIRRNASMTTSNQATRMSAEVLLFIPRLRAKVAIMVRIEFASSIQRYAPIQPIECDASTIAESLSVAFDQQPSLRGYLLDDQGAVRKHVTIFVNDQTIRDRTHQTDPLKSDDTIYVMQALSGG